MTTTAKDDDYRNYYYQSFEADPERKASEAFGAQVEKSKKQEVVFVKERITAIGLRL